MGRSHVGGTVRRACPGGISAGTRASPSQQKPSRGIADRLEIPSRGTPRLTVSRRPTRKPSTRRMAGEDGNFGAAGLRSSELRFICSHLKPPFSWRLKKLTPAGYPQTASTLSCPPSSSQNGVGPRRLLGGHILIASSHAKSSAAMSLSCLSSSRVSRFRRSKLNHSATTPLSCRSLLGMKEIPAKENVEMGLASGVVGLFTYAGIVKGEEKD